MSVGSLANFPEASFNPGGRGRVWNWKFTLLSKASIDRRSVPSNDGTVQTQTGQSGYGNAIQQLSKEHAFATGAHCGWVYRTACSRNCPAATRSIPNSNGRSTDDDIGHWTVLGSGGLRACRDSWCSRRDRASVVGWFYRAILKEPQVS